jgi:hypothetical protein
MGFSLLMIAAVARQAAAQSQAPPDPGAWRFVVAPYLMAASMDGATTLRGFDVTVDVSASDIFSNLEFGAMGMFIAQKGPWGFGADAIWMTVGAPVPNVDVDFSQGAFSFYGMRQLASAADLTFGMRVNTLSGSFTFAGSVLDDIEQDATWVDPLVGLWLRGPAEGRVLFRVYSEIGGFGAGSDFTWQIFPIVGVVLGRGVSLELGYRWLDVDYATGEGSTRFRYDVLTQGPAFGAAFRF